MLKVNNNAIEKPTMPKIAASLGELVAAAGELAFVFSDNDREGYDLARLALIEFIKNTAHHRDSNEEFASLDSPSHHLH
jgi:hypothetical protein